MEKMDLWAQWGRERVGRMEKVASIYIHYHVPSGQLQRNCYIAL